MKEQNIEVPSMQKPENTGSEAAAEDDFANDDDNSDDDDSDYSDSDDSDYSDDQTNRTRKPVEGNGLLEQIVNLQKKDHANALGLSLREKKSKPLQKSSASGKNTLG